MNDSQDISKKIYKLEEGLDIKYRTDQYGLFKGFVNISEIKQLMKETTEKVIMTEDMDDEEKNIFKNTINMLLKSDKQINALLSKNIYYLLLLNQDFFLLIYL